MLEDEPPGVERGAAEVAQESLTALRQAFPAGLTVHRVSDDRMPEVLEMDPDLVRPAGFEGQAE